MALYCGYRGTSSTLAGKVWPFGNGSIPLERAKACPNRRFGLQPLLMHVTGAKSDDNQLAVLQEAGDLAITECRVVNPLTRRELYAIYFVPIS